MPSQAQEYQVFRATVRLQPHYMLAPQRSADPGTRAVPEISLKGKVPFDPEGESVANRSGCRLLQPPARKYRTIFRELMSPDVQSSGSRRNLKAKGQSAASRVTGKAPVWRATTGRRVQKSCLSALFFAVQEGPTRSQ